MQFDIFFKGPFVMVDELLKMIAECHLQKPQTTSKMKNVVTCTLRYFAELKYNVIPLELHYSLMINCSFAHMLI